MAVVKLHLQIERLRLEGFSKAEARRTTAALERELGRLVATGGLPGHLQKDLHIPRLDGGRVQLSQNGAPRQLGRHLARQIYRGSQGKKDFQHPHRSRTSAKGN